MEHTSTTSAPVAPTHTQDAYASEKLRLEGMARRAGDENTMWQLAESMPWSLATRFSVTDKTGEDFVPDLHFLWFLYYQGSKNTTTTSPAQHRLALQVIQLQERGALTRRRRRSSVTTQQDGSDDFTTAEIATTVEGGVLWTELPFLVSDMMEFWARDCATMSAAHRVNFSHFLAQLASAGVAKDEFGGIALVLFHDALETPRPLKSAVREEEEEEEENSKRSLADLTVSDLLPAVEIWLVRASTKLIQLSDARWQHCSAEAGAIGDLYRDDALQTSPKLPGFSPERWIFWLWRLEQIAQEAKEQRLKGLEDMATRAMDAMLLRLNESCSEVRSKFEAAPEVVKYRNPLWQLYLGSM